MKKLLFVLLFSIPLWGCVQSDGRKSICEMDMGFLRGKTILQAVSAMHGNEVSIIFTDNTSITISTGDCYMYMKKQ